jgi:hypothetical protein
MLETAGTAATLPFKLVWPGVNHKLTGEATSPSVAATLKLAKVVHWCFSLAAVPTGQVGRFR